MKNKKILISFFLVLSLITTLIVGNNFHLNATALSKYGSTGSEVTQIQQKLSDLGFYKGNIDGVYGSSTKSAVTAFQRDRGLTADGIAGSRTLSALGLSSATEKYGYTQSEIDLLARTISAESRGEPYQGQVAVGAVILNRIEHPSFPNTMAGVVYQNGAFSCVDDGQMDEDVYESSKRAAIDALNGWDPSGGAIYYYNPKTATNKWIRSRPVIVTIGDHVFCS